MKNKFIWDSHSDQPYPIEDKKYKKAMKSRSLGDFFALLLTNILVFPLGVISAYFLNKKSSHSADFFALCVNLDKGDIQVALIEELGCTSLQIRLPLADIANLEKYLRFAEKFSNKKILITVLQTREHIEDHRLLEKHIKLIFQAFNDLAPMLQIGNAINRTKWGFFSVGEYLRFYQVVNKVRDQHFPNYQLVGPSVIDYEYHFTIRALFNGFKLRFDKLSALLYVDRRGAPENTQMGVFDTSKKIDFLYALCKFSPKTTADILLTEVNWPLANTAPWAPTSETECVDEDTYSNYMLRFYCLALASGKVEAVYWHQLIAPGYGLIDSREGVRKRAAFYVFKQMLAMLQSASVEKFSLHDSIYRLVCRKEGRQIEVLWLNSDTPLRYLSSHLVLDKMGQKIAGDIYLSQSPIYVLH